MLRERRVEALESERVVQEKKLLLDEERVKKELEIKRLKIISKTELYKLEQEMKGIADGNYLKNLQNNGTVSENYLIELLRYRIWENISNSNNKTIIVPLDNKLKLHLNEKQVDL